MNAEQEFHQWILENYPQSEITSMGRIKLLVGNTLINWVDLPEPMKRGVIADWTTHLMKYYTEQIQ